MKTRIMTLAGILWCVLFFLGCQDQGREPDSVSKITIHYLGDERIFGPMYDMPAKLLVFQPLFTWNEKGDIVGLLVERWEHSEDYKTWTYHLRPGIRWHDGIPLTAQDVRFTLDLYTHPEFPYMGYADTYSVKVIDDLTFSITYNQKRDPQDTYTTILPMHVLEGKDLKEIYEWDFWLNPVGTGPYRYVRHVPATMVELEANPDYFGGKPRIERVILKFGGQPLTELLSGNVDVITNVDQMTRLKLEEDSRFRSYYSLNARELRTIYWNHTRPFFKNPAVRKALTMAINRQEIINLLDLPNDIPILDFFVTIEQYKNKNFPDPIPYDPEQAKKLLDRAGWIDKDDDNIREKEGKKFEFKAMVSYNLEGDSASHVYIQEQFRRIGIRMEIETLEFSVLRSRLRSGDYDAAFFPFTNIRLANWVERGSSVGYENPEVLERLKRSADDRMPGSDDRLYMDLLPIFQRDVPLTFLYPSVWTTIAPKRIRGLSSPFRSDPVWCLEHLWTEEEK
jgi:peptide/nickel transport system substrate-binding protein